MSDHEPDPGPQPAYLEERVCDLERDVASMRRRLDKLAALVGGVVTLLKEMREAVQGDES
jgi:hypothetical protein